MADSAGQVSSKSTEKNKLSNSVSRTTSETLRLTDSEKTVTQPSSLSSSTPRKKTSFQITSVVTLGSRTSNDGGDDSADDLDESHTDDISEVIDISRDIENETPSYSEDTFSKDDVFFNASASLGSAPVIPTSSQYGLAILATPDNCETILNPTDNCGNSVTGTELHVGVSDNVINLGVVSTKPDPEMRDIHTHTARHERFKVVKIESTEPFKRGRWVCMDYLDHSMSQPKPNAVSGPKTDSVGTKTNENIGNKPIDVNESSPQNFSTSESIVSATETTQTVGTPATEESQPTSEQVSNVVPVSVPQADNSQLSNNQQIPISSQQPYNSISPGQSLQSNIQLVSSNVVNSSSQVSQQAQSLSQVPVQQSVATSQHQSLQPQQIQQVLANVNVIPVQQQQSNIPQPSLIQQPIQQMQPVQQQPQQFTQQQQFPTIQQQQPIIQQQISQPIQSVQQVHLSNVQQNIQGMPMQQPSGQQMQQLQQQTMQQLPQQASQMHQVSYTQPLPQQTITQSTSQPPVQNMMQQIHPQQMHSFQQNPVMTNIMPVQSQPHMPPQYYSNVQPIQQGMTPSQAQILPPMSQGNTMPQVSLQGSNAHISLQNFPVTSLPQQMLPSMPQTPPVATSVPSYSLQFPPTSHIPTPTNQQPIVTPQIPAMPNMVQPYVTMGTYASVVSSVPSTDQVCVTASPDVANTEQAPQAAALLESLAEVTANPDEVPQGEDAESASGASAVAIDNKIEQAMDLVKSHLMFAVREEVEVLKEKIAELMERITQLEQENSILKANATQETLAQLPPPTPASQQQPANPP